MQLHPTTEKVPARRGIPVVVSVVAIAFVALLVAKPWEPRPATPAHAASAGPSNAVAAVGTSTPPVVFATPGFGPTPSAPRPAPTPDVAPLGALGEIALPYTPGQAMAQCDYRGRNRVQQRLASVTVQPPTVLLDADASTRDISRVGWFLELQKNRAQDVFHRDWQTISRSRTHVLGLTSGQAARFAPLTVRHEGGAGETEVYRVRMVIEWYTRNLELAGSATIVANHYQEAADERIGAWPPYCRGAISRPRA